MLGDKLNQNLVLGQSPGTSDTVSYIVKFKPSCVTLDLRLSRHQLADSIPRVVAKLTDKCEKFFILKLTMSGSF